MSKRGQLLRFLMLVEKRVLSILLLTVSLTFDDFEPNETTENMVESQLCENW